ncbi:MAG: Ig-like domain-containing protein [Microthrixaceae bacterium]
MHSPARERAAARNAWHGHPGYAFGIRALAWGVPVVASVLATMAASRVLPTPKRLLGVVLWWIALSALSMGVLWVVDRLARRLLPLAALFKLSLVFPDTAPSRYRIALRSGTTAQLQHRVEEIRASGHLGDTDAESAETLLELIGALSVHDRLTRGHSERVRAYAQMIGEEMGLDAEDLDRLHWAGLVHDVGKLYVASEILNKETRLTDDEYEAIKVHPVAGAELCAPLRAWLGPWLDAVGEHHERWDGKGYPNGLAGEQISLGARIVAVADVFDVITSARSYKDPSTSVEAREELARCAGTQFDPQVVRAFLNVGLGRLRLVMGPLSWLAQNPVLGNVPLNPVMGALASIGAVVGSIAVGNLVQTPHVVSERAPVTAPAPEVTTTTSTTTTTPTTVPPAVPPPVVPDPPSPVPPVVPVWTPPAGKARDDVASGPEDAAVVLQPLANDDHLTTITAAGPATSGTLQVLGDSLVYTPSPDFSGSDSFTYEATGTDGQSGSATAHVTILPVNDAPTFTAGGPVTVTEDADLVTASAWATSISPGPNDEALQSLGFTVTADDPSLFASAPAIDEVTGDLTFTALADVNGATNVTVELVDSGGTSNGGRDTSSPLTFAITISPVADPPVAVDDASTLTEDGPATIIDLLANDSDPDGDPLTISVLDTSALTRGTAVDNGDGTITYTPDPEANGTDTITYTIDDGTGRTDTATLVITLTPIADPPVAVADDYATDESTLLSQAAPGLLTNDSDPDGDPLTVTTTPVSDVSNGTLILSGDGAFDYTPDPGFVGTDQFTYEVQDGTGRSAQATVTVTVDSGVTALGFYLGTSGADADNWSFSPTPVGVSGTEPDHDGDSSPGLTIVNSGQQLTESAGAQYQSWTLTTSAPLSLKGPVTLDLWSTVEGFAASQDIDYSIWLQDCASDGTGCAILASAIDVHINDWNGGTADWVERSITFGSLDTTIASGRMLRMRLMFHHQDVWVAASADRASQLVLTRANATPMVNDDSVTVLEDAVATPIDVLANDVDANLNPATVAVLSGPTQGVATANPDGTIDYTPAADLNGADSFTYQVCDTGGLCGTATVSVTITPVNDAPSFTDAGDVTVSAGGGSQTFPGWASAISAGPADESGQSLTFSVSVSDPSKFVGTPTVDASGTLSIEPMATAGETFVVTVTLLDDGGTADGGDDTSTIHTFTVTVT